jgi:K+-sensing histidine kinase KdpD
MADDMPRILSLLSHELRGPLGVMRGYLRLVTQTSTELSPRSQESIAAALRASDRMADILDEASLLAHLQIGDVRLNPKRFPLTAVVHAAIQAATLPQGAAVDLDSAALPNVTIHADDPRMRTALATLISACARGQSSNVAVAITADVTSPATASAVRLRIARRTSSSVDATETDLDTRRGGFGLAIPIAAVIIEGHGGGIRELRNGERSHGFVVTLPVTEPTET